MRLEKTTKHLHIEFIVTSHNSVWFNMKAIPKFDIKSVIRFGNRFDIRIKQTSWIGHESRLAENQNYQKGSRGSIIQCGSYK